MRHLKKSAGFSPIIIVIGVIFVLLVSIGVVLWTRNSRSSSETPTTQSETATPKQNTSKVQFDSYNLKAPLPTVPEQITVYSLNDSYTKQDAEKLAKQFGFKSLQINDQKPNIIIGDSSQTNQLTMLTMNLNSGSYSLVTTGEFQVTTKDQDITKQAQNYLTQIGQSDQLLVPTATYKMSELPKVTFVEFHRDWSKAGLPILNFPSLLNVPESRKLSQLSFGKPDSFAAGDKQVVGTSDKSDGKMRPQGFNTLTVGIFDATLNSSGINSTIRAIAKQQVVDGKKLKTPQQALEELKGHKAVISLTAPTGSGLLDRTKLEQQNNVAAKTADITDVALAYLEDYSDKSQSRLTPYYIFRGTAQTTTGYKVQFIEAIPALTEVQKGDAYISSTNKVLAENITIDTFNPDQPTSTTAPNPTAQATARPTAHQCQYADRFTNQVGLPGGGVLAYYPPMPDFSYTEADLPHETPITPYVATGGRIFFYVPDNGMTQAQIDAALAPYQDQGTFEQLRLIIDVQCQPLSNSVCPVTAATRAGRCIYVSAGSPSVYVYSNSSQHVSVQVQPKYPLTYVDPVLTDAKKQIWNVFTGQNGALRLTDETEHGRLYYEYDTQQFRPIISQLQPKDTGYVVKKTGLGQLLDTVLPQLGLTPAEQADLTTEATREVNQLTSDYIFVSLVPRALLDQYLPITITPQPQTLQRMHLYIGSAKATDRVSQPVLTPLARTPYTVIETGVIIGN